MNKPIKTWSCPWALANEMYPEIDKELIDEMLFCEVTELITNYYKAEKCEFCGELMESEEYAFCDICPECRDKHDRWL